MSIKIKFVLMFTKNYNTFIALNTGLVLWHVKMGQYQVFRKLSGQYMHGS